MYDVKTAHADPLIEPRMVGIRNAGSTTLYVATEAGEVKVLEPGQSTVCQHGFTLRSSEEGGKAVYVDMPADFALIEQ
jgi:hypothetical protein